MKTLTKISSLLLALALALGLCTTAAFAVNDGDITITNATKDTKYSVYKLFDAAYEETKGTTYSIPLTDNDMLGAARAKGSPFTVASEAVNDAYPVALAADKDEKDVINWINDNFAKKDNDGKIIGYSLTPAAAEQTATTNTVTFDLGADAYGYYFVTSSLGTVLTIDSNTPSATVIDKNDSTINVTNAKTVTAINGNENNTTSAKVGDTISFKIEFTAQNYVTKDGVTKVVSSYIVEDTPTNMEISINSLKIKINGKDATATNESTLTKDGFKQILTWATKTDNVWTSTYAEGATITVTYDAVVTAGAATAEAKNAAEVKYTLEEDTTPQGPDTPPTPVTVKTYSVDVVKTAVANTTTDTYNVLSGAKFKLYDAATDGNEIALVYDATGGYYRPAVGDETGVAIEAGEITIKGLAANTTYYLEETEAPAGYNKLTSRVAVAIAETNLTNTASVNNVYTKGRDTGIQVINETGSLLPSTGGIGTTIFYVVGSILVVGAGVLLVVKRRMRNDG